MAERQEEIAQRESEPFAGANPPIESCCKRCFSAMWCLWLLGLTLIAVSRFAAALAWPIDLLANVSYFVVVPAMVTLGIALFRRRYRVAAAALAIAIIGAWPVRSMFLPATSGAPTALVPPERHLARILVVNVHGSKAALDGLIPLLVREQPDAAVVIEVLPGLEGYFADNPEVREILPFVVGPERGMTWRDMLLSRHPLHRLRFEGDDERYKFVYAYRRSCFVDKPDGRFLFTGAHPPSPRDAASWSRGNELISLLAEVSRLHLLPAGAPVVIGGDFNASPSGHRHRLMLDQSGLRPVDEIGGLAGTWRSDWPAALRLTIDRVWASPEVEFISREVLEDIGSDHRPILVTVSLPRGK